MPWDRYDDLSPGVEMQATNAFVITPDDDADLPFCPISIYVGGGGDVTVIMRDGEDPITYKNCPAGKDLNIRPRRVMATDTTATHLVGAFHGPAE